MQVFNCGVILIRKCDFLKSAWGHSLQERVGAKKPELSAVNHQERGYTQNNNENKNENKNDIMFFVSATRTKEMSWGNIGHFRKYTAMII